MDKNISEAEKQGWRETWTSTLIGMQNSCGYCCASCQSRENCRFRCTNQDKFDCLNCKYD